MTDPELAAMVALQEERDHALIESARIGFGPIEPRPELVEVFRLIGEVVGYAINGFARGVS